MTRSFPPRAPALLATLVLLVAPPSPGAEFSVSGRLGISSTAVNAGGSTPFFTISGSDEDASPAWGGTLGFAFALNEIAPRIRIPQLDEVPLPAWKIRFELEGLTGREYEFRTDGGDGFFTDATTRTFLANLWLDVPLYAAMRPLLGRVPALEPLSIYVGAGIGRANLEVETTDNFSEGQIDESSTAIQYGLGLAYALTPRTTVSFGVRTLDLGDVDVPLSFQPGTVSGSHEFELQTREFVTALRHDFYTAPLETMHPRHWRWPDVSLPHPSSWRLPWRRSAD